MKWVHNLYEDHSDGGMRASDIVYVVFKIGLKKFLEVEVQVGITGPGK